MVKKDNNQNQEAPVMGAPKAQIVIPGEIKPPETPDLLEQGGLDVEELKKTDKELSDMFSESLEKMGSSAQQLQSLSESYIKGEIPADVQGQIRRMTSEKGLASGIGRGQAGQALTARDLGITSLQLQSTGAELASSSASLRQAQGQMAESKRQYEKSRELSTRQFLEDMRRTDLQASELELRRKSFNAEQNMRLIQTVAETAIQRSQLLAEMSAKEIQTKGTQTYLDSIVKQLDQIFAKNP